MSNTYVKRTTLFKIPQEHIDTVLREYETLRKNAVKVRPGHLPQAEATQDGKPYVVSNVARRITNTDSPLSEGYTVSSQTLFKSREDHEFYDKDCAAHKELKKTTGPLRTGVMTVVTEGEWYANRWARAEAVRVISRSYEVG